MGAGRCPRACGTKRPRSERYFLAKAIWAPPPAKPAKMSPVLGGRHRAMSINPKPSINQTVKPREPGTTSLGVGGGE